MNILLLNKIQAKIKERPDLFQLDWTRVKLGCGTAYCIAGWACHLEGEDLEVGIMDRARVLLDLDLSQSGRLFFDGNWPKEFRSRGHTPTGSGKASADLVDRAIRRIDHFIATNGEE